MNKLIFVSVMGLASTVLLASNTAEDKSDDNSDAPLEKARYITKAEEASIIWTGGKITGGSHTGTLTLKDNALEFYGRDLAGGSFTIDMESMTTTDLSGGSADKLIGHLKSDDFFGVATYPTSTFTITKVEDGMEPGIYEVTGDMTIKSTTLPIRFKVQMDWEGNMAIANANITVNRADFDVRFGSGRFFDNLGNKAIKDEFELDVKIVSYVGE
jgi:polyisoprenoid-binding protein YceI